MYLKRLTITPLFAALLCAVPAGAQPEQSASPPPAASTASASADAGKSPESVSAPSTPSALAFSTSPHPTVEFKGWTFQLYGFAEFDAIHDSTQGFGDLAGNTLVAHSGTVAAEHGQTQFSVRNSRLGLKLGAPVLHGVKAGGIFEMDFLGNQPAIQQTGSVNGGNAVAGGISEGAFFNNPTFRIRHMALTIETPFVDVLAGQYWELFGWQPYFHPNTVEIQGVVGQIYSRTAQLRLSHKFSSKYVAVEVAAAMLRPPERVSEAPDGQAGVRISFPMWQGVHTAGSTGTSADAAAIGVSGVLRKFSMPDPAGSSKPWDSTNGQGVSVDAFLPIIPATADNRSNALSITGSYVYGAGIADLYTGLSGGLGLQQGNVEGALKTCPQSTGSCYSSPIDGGLVAYNSQGQLTAIQWQSFMVGVQYYLPGGFLWVSSNYAQMNSNNSQSLAGSGSAKSTANELRRVDANIFWDITSSARLGFMYARMITDYNDNTEASNDRLQLSAFYIF